MLSALHKSPLGQIAAQLCVRQHQTRPQMLDALKTQHLALRPFSATDTPALFQFMSDASAMEHTYIARSNEECAVRLSGFEAMRDAHGFAPWVISRIESSEVIGWGGLRLDSEEPEWGLEVAYAFSPLVWGKGYATELVLYSLKYAFEQLSVKEVHAYAKPQNARSSRVLLKCGFSYQRYEPSIERNHYLTYAPSAV